MKVTKSNRQIWQEFFETATAFRDMKPWEWMYDQDMLGVQDPSTGQTGYCCIMGAAKEVFALGVYYGKEGYYSYMKLLDFAAQDEIDRMAAGMEQEMLKVEFVNSTDVDKKDREVYKVLCLKFRGKNQWIQAREMSPGYFPWYISDEQAVYMTLAMKQVMEVALRFREDVSILEDDKGKILVRVPVETGGGLTWEDQYYFEPDEEDIPQRKVDVALVEKAHQTLKREKAAICFSLCYLPGAFKEKGRPFFSRIAMWIAYGSGFVLGFETMSPDDYEKKFDALFFKHLFTLGYLPQQLLVNSSYAEAAIEPIAEALGIELIYAPEVEDFQAVGEILMMGNRF